MDNLNTHGIALLYDAFTPEEAFAPAQRLEIHYTRTGVEVASLTTVGLAAWRTTPLRMSP